MVLIPARCARCGHVFQPAGGINISGSSNVTMSNNVTGCPECGGVARFIDGVLDVKDEAIVLKSGPQWSADVIERLRLGLSRAAHDDIEDPDEFIRQELPEIAEPVTQAVDAMSRRSPRTSRRTLLRKAAGWLLLLIAEGAIQEVANEAIGINEDAATPEQVQRIVHDELQRIIDSGRLPAKPKPRKAPPTQP